MLSSQHRSVHSEAISQEADRLTREALCRWGCAHPESAWDANRAVTAYQEGRVQDYEDDLGAETFLVSDRCAPDGAFVAARDWCACDPTKEYSICYHSLAVCLVLGYRSHYARLHAKRPLRAVALIVKKSFTKAHDQAQLGEHLADVIQQNRAVVGGAK
jgi:hypothetical protein